MDQKKLLSSLCEQNKDAVIVGSLGTISRDLGSIEHPNKILVKGAMGCVLGIGLGYALHSPKKVIVVIGDGSYLMKMGSISTIAYHKPKNLEIHVLNNNCYASCGGQTTNFRYLINGSLPIQIHEVSS